MTTAKDQARFTKQKNKAIKGDAVKKKVQEEKAPPSWESSGESPLYRAYHSRENGGMYFSPENMRAFSTTIIDVWYNPVTTDYLFITHEVRRNLTQRNTPYHTLRHLNARGKIRNLTPLESNYSTCSKMLTAITTNKSPLPENT